MPFGPSRAFAVRSQVGLRPLVLFFALLVLGTVARGETQPKPLIAQALAPGDTIMFVAPAKYLEKGRVMLAKQRLEDMGFRVRLPENLFRKHGFLGGTDEERAAELMAAFSDPEIDAIFPGTGGYGTTRILDKLDYATIRKNPKVFIGFSDITALHIAINQRTGLVTFHSPNPMFGLGGEENLSPFAGHWFWRALLKAQYDGGSDAKAGGGYLIETRPHAGVNRSETSGDRADGRGLFADVPRAATMSSGRAEGRLTGGNLSVLHALMGTPFEIETAGRILFLEDVGEAPYRVDRMLSTMRLAGKFDKVHGVVLGAFTAREGEAEWDDDASVNDVLRDYFAELGVPVLANFPVGHVRYNTTLPIGARVELDADRQTVRVLEDPVRR